MSALSERPESPSVGLAIPHESAALHVTGRALYTDDLVERTKDVLHAWPVQAPHANAYAERWIRTANRRDGEQAQYYDVDRRCPMQ